jgi:hypothetical protein
MDDPSQLSQSNGTAIPPQLDFPPGITAIGQNTQCVTMPKIYAAAGDRVQLLQDPAPPPRRRDGDTTQTIAFGSR